VGGERAAVGGSKAGCVREAVRGGKAGGGRKAVGGRKADDGGKADKVAPGADGELKKLQELVAEVNKLKMQVANLAATVNTNTEQLDTQSHDIDGLASSFNTLKIEVRTACKPATQSSGARDIDGDDEEATEDPRPRKRVRFAVTEAEKSTEPAPEVRAFPDSPPPSQCADAALSFSPVTAASALTPQLPAGPSPVPSELDIKAPTPPPSRSLTTAAAVSGPTLSGDPVMRRAQGTVSMQGIRDLLTPRVTKLIAHVTVTSDVFLDPESKYEMIVENAMEHMRVTSDEANAFLLEIINLPTKKRVRGSVNPRCARACAPVGMVFSHAMGAIKAVIVAAWFQAAGSTTSTMAIPSAIRWKDNRSYGQSDGGRVGVIAAAKQLFIHLNARYRINQPANEGDVAVVHLTHGHYALICTLVREALDAVITGHSSSGSPDGDRYKRYVAEAVSLDDYLPTHSRPENGLVIVDGGDGNRAVFPEEYMPVPGANGNGDQAAAAPAAGA